MCAASSWADPYYQLVTTFNNGSIIYGTVGGNPVEIDFAGFLAIKGNITFMMEENRANDNTLYVSTSTAGGVRFKHEMYVTPDGKNMRINFYTGGDLISSEFYTSSRQERDNYVRQGQASGGDVVIPVTPNNPNSSVSSGSSSSRSSTYKVTCPKCNGRKWRSDSHRYQVNADDYHWLGGYGCPYCSSTTEHWHSHCNYCDPDGTVTQRR